MFDCIRDVDRITGFVTRNIMCQPVRVNKGSGNVIAVVQMLNKTDPGGFTESDQEVLSVCVRKVGDELCDRFRDLLQAAEKVYGTSELVTNTTVSRYHRFDDPTKASSNYSSRENTLTFGELMSKLDAVGRGELASDALAFTSKGEKAVDVSAEQRKASRRKSYSRTLQAGATDNPSSPEELTALAGGIR